MKAFSIVIVGFFFLAFTFGCLANELTIDGTTKETFAASTKAIADSLSPEEKPIFQAGLLNLIVTRYPPASGATGLALLAFMPQAAEVAHITMNGVTKSEILARGQEVQFARAPPSPKANFSALRSCLQQHVLITNARTERDGIGVLIKVEVTNNLVWPISFVQIGYKVTTQGRSVPWANDNFGMNISGGIEPGEMREISTNVFGIPRIANDLTTKAEILDVADAEERHLVGEVHFLGNSDQPSPHRCE
ncbi:hypothetical protein X743_14405 [Mesorhizobium sp. LNHC252B00]|uniref:hypothetical protein n=1 Tax=Mesorhizobium sp. LNHC252B00 TaxID=1287252 RepID=UPI0003CEDEB3|nr:hypothetical protein [Mesorhizobium sp. LNHC252B00]ESY72768.1 hypothetical protein X743_14405 [Mesorhizobium sp. LNHC252B00]